VALIVTLPTARKPPSREGNGWFRGAADWRAALEMTNQERREVAAAPANVDLSGIARPEGGKTIGEIYAEKAALAGKQVVLRAKVVKFNTQIMGKNWLHVRDGSGDAAQGTHDLTVTTDAAAKIGDTVLVSGKLHLDRDFGFGYKYDALIEGAKVTVEQ